MRQSNERKGLVFLCAFVLLAGVVGGTASAAPVIDGNVTLGEYSTLFPVVYDKSADKGDFYVNQDANGRLSVAFVVPKSYVDNTYGTTAIGWGKKGHDFKELVGSDASTIAIKDTSGKTFLEFKMDYVSSLGDKKGTTGPWGSLGVTGGEGDMIVGSASSILQAQSSLGYNWNQFGAAHPEFFGENSNSPAADANYQNSALPGWVYEVVYEASIDASAFAGKSFDPTDPDSFQITSMHASPNKQDIGTPNIIPEPTSLIAWSLLSGFGLFGVARNRRQKKA